MQTWFLYLMVSTVAEAIADFLSKVLFRQHHGLTVGGYLLASWLIEILVLFVFVLGWRLGVAESMYLSWFFWLLLGMTFVLRFGGNILYYTSIRRLDVSIVTVLFTFSTLVSVVLGIFIHNESRGRMKWAGVALTIGAIVLVYSHISWKKKEMIFFWFVLCSAILYGIVANISSVREKNRTNRKTLDIV